MRHLKLMPYAVVGLSATLALLVACNFGPSPTKPGGTSDEPTFASILSSLTELSVAMPRSLALDSSAAKKSPRAIGDVAEYSGAGSDSIRSDAWESLHDPSLFNMFNGIITALANYAKEHSFVSGDTLSLDLSLDMYGYLAGFPAGTLQSIPVSFTYSNKARLVGTDPRDFKLYLRVKLDIPDMASGLEYYGVFSFLTPESGDRMIKAEAQTSLSQMDGNSIDRCTLEYNRDTGSCTIQDGVGLDVASVGDSVLGTVVVTPLAGGGISEKVAMVSSHMAMYYVGKGDDQSGGVAYALPGLIYESDCFDATGKATIHTSGTGLGSSPSTDGLNNILTSLAVSTAPSSLYVRHTNLSDTWDISVDNATWVAVTPTTPFGFWCYLQGASWADGDAYYYPKAIVHGPESTVYEMYIGWRPQAAVTIGSDAYYCSTSYPIDRLLPLASAYASSYTLKTKESGTTMDPVTGGTLKTYDFWLENSSSSDSSSCEPETGDIDLKGMFSVAGANLHTVTGVERVPVYSFETTEGIPAYFSDPDPSGIAATTETQMKASLGDFIAQGLDSFKESLRTDLTLDSNFADLTL